MSTSMSRWAGRVGAVGAGMVAALALAGTAYAHVEVEADPAVAGATNAALTFTAEAESPTAGVASVRVVLPTGIAPSEVSLAKAPTNWTLTPSADGYQVGGPALPKGQQAVHSITVARLPNVAELPFKTLVTYSDGSVDRWIEERSAANPNPDHPAPVLKLAPGTQPATAAPTPAAAAAGPTLATNAASPTTGDTTDTGGASWLWWVLGAVVVLGIGAAALRLRRLPARGDKP